MSLKATMKFDSWKIFVEVIPAKYLVKPKSQKIIPAECSKKNSRKLIPAEISYLKDQQGRIFILHFHSLFWYLFADRHFKLLDNDKRI